MNLLVLILLLILLFGGVPLTHVHYGLAGSGALGTVLVVVLILVLLGRV